jgi:hypothetical protein
MSLHLFPHCHWSESIIKKIIFFFGPVKTYLPWMMKTPDILNNMSIEISNPPIYLKPGNSFRAILAEYRSWAQKNHDRNYLELIKLGWTDKLTDNTTWEIRQMLGRTVESLSTKEEKVIRWHLLLHLYGDIEEKRLEADNLLKVLKDKKSPLDGSIENNGDIKNLLEDLSDLGTESVLNDTGLIQIFEAWFGLFGGYLNENESLITYNRQVMDYVSERWDALYHSNVSTVSPAIKFNVPDLSNHFHDVRNQIQRENNIDEILKEIKGLITSIGKSPTHNLAALDRLSKKLDNSIQWTSSNRALRCTLRYLYPIQDKEITESDMILRPFFNQTIILAEE